MRQYVCRLGGTPGRPSAAARDIPYRFYVADRARAERVRAPGRCHRREPRCARGGADESQLAAILAHEIAHVSERHAAAQLTDDTLARWGIGLLGALLGNVGGAFTAQIVATAAVEGTMRSFSREDERRCGSVKLSGCSRAQAGARAP